MPAPEPYVESVAPPIERCFKLTLAPIGWKARMWRAFDDSVTIMMRLDAPTTLRELIGTPIHDVLEPFQPSLRALNVYLERGASVALPMPWSMGRASFEHDHSVVFLHRVLDDPFGLALAGLFRAATDTRADVTLILSPYELTPQRAVFAVRDYDIGCGASLAG